MPWNLSRTGLLSSSNAAESRSNSAASDPRRWRLSRLTSSVLTGRLRWAANPRSCTRSRPPVARKPYKNGWWTGSLVQPALGLGRAGPAAGPHVVALAHRTGARPAADRGVPPAGQRVGRQQLHGRVVLDVGVGPRRHRVDLDDVAQ